MCRRLVWVCFPSLKAKLLAMGRVSVMENKNYFTGPIGSNTPVFSLRSVFCSEAVDLGGTLSQSVVLNL